MKRIIDPIDVKIIEELTRNARISHSDLAKAVNLSRNAVRQRIERLERDHVINGYTIARGAGLADTVAANFFVYRHDRMRGANVINVIKSIPDVVACDIVSGEFDLIVRVEAESGERVRELWDQISSIDGVVNTVTALVLASPVCVRRYIPASAGLADSAP